MQKALAAFETAFGKRRRRVPLNDWLPTISFGIKVDGVKGTIEPKIKLEPRFKDADGNAGNAELPIIDINSIKNRIDDILLSLGKVLFILVDRIDEFVAADDYEIQKNVLAGLLQVEASYRGLKGLRIKVFLRKDLFEKLDLSEHGIDKLRARAVNLDWSDEDIRGFVARRIWFNYFRVLKLGTLDMQIGSDRLNVSEEMIKRIVLTGSTAGEWRPHLGGFLEKILRKKSGIVEDRMRLISWADQVHRETITSIMPHKVLHKSKAGAVREITLFEFLETHFVLGSGYSTPRIILGFLDKCICDAKEYWRKNPDLTLTLDDRNEYPLIKREIIFLAYSDYQRETFESFSRFSAKWASPFNRLADYINQRGSTEFSYSDLADAFSNGLPPDFDEFVAYLRHIGYLKCLNPQVPHMERRFYVPILFQGLRSQTAVP